MHTFFNQEDSTRMGRILLTLAIAGTLLLGMMFINQIKTFGTIGVTPSQTNTINVTGTGEAFMVPDVAVITFSVQKKGATIDEAQKSATTVVNDAIAFAKDSGIAEKDIKTESYNAYPEYSTPVPCYRTVCPQEQPKIVGYVVSQSVTVKVRDTEKVGAFIDGIGAKGISTIDGPQFTVDNPDAVQAQARADAIKDAKQKAQSLAKQLGVHIVRVAQFNESNNTPYPVMYQAKSMAMDSAGAQPTTAVPAGENKYTSNVTITYEIR